MNVLRKRIPFEYPGSDADREDNDVLDEQEQEALIQSLKESNGASSRRYLKSLGIILGLSFFLQVLSFYDNPILVIFPPTSSSSSLTIPLPTTFTLLTIALHINIALLAFQDDITMQLQLSDVDVHPLSYQLSYALAAVAPCLSIFLQRSWQVTFWWGITVAVIFTAHYITSAINQMNENISELESMKYVAPGA